MDDDDEDDSSSSSSSSNNNNSDTVDNNSIRKMKAMHTSYNSLTIGLNLADAWKYNKIMRVYLNTHIPKSCDFKANGSSPENPFASWGAL
jgi:hypothetical protein